MAMGRDFQSNPRDDVTSPLDYTRRLNTIAQNNHSQLYTKCQLEENTEDGPSPLLPLPKDYGLLLLRGEMLSGQVDMSLCV